jgi:hypothetical protein
MSEGDEQKSSPQKKEKKTYDWVKRIGNFSPLSL